MSDMRPTLRPVREADIEDYVRWLNDPEVIQYMNIEVGDVTPESERSWYARITEPNSASVYYAIDVGDKHIGNCGLHQIDYPNRHAQFGIMIGEKKEWDKGYASEASRLIIDFGFKQLGLNRISLQVYAHNTRAQRVYEKLSFAREGILRESYFRDGRYHDTLVMGILKSEWRGDQASVLE